MSVIRFAFGCILMTLGVVVALIGIGGFIISMESRGRPGWEYLLLLPVSVPLYYWGLTRIPTRGR